LKIKRINLTKRVFRQGEIIQLKLNHSRKDLPITSCKVFLIGTEKTEFTLQSLFGKRGFHPTLGLLFPSKHFVEQCDFLESTFEINPTGTDVDQVEIEIPTNAIPSYYGDNSKVSYILKVEILTNTGLWIREEEEILIDSEYQGLSIEEKIEIGDGLLSLTLPSPLIINSESIITIITKNLTMSEPIRLVLVGEEIATALGVTVRNSIKDLPLGQFFSKEDINDFSMRFHIPSEYQHSYEGLQSRIEYHIEILYVSSQRRLGITRERLRKISRIQVQVEEL